MLKTAKKLTLEEELENEAADLFLTDTAVCDILDLFARKLLTPEIVIKSLAQFRDQARLKAYERLVINHERELMDSARNSFDRPKPEDCKHG